MRVGIGKLSSVSLAALSLAAAFPAAAQVSESPEPGADEIPAAAAVVDLDANADAAAAGGAVEATQGVEDIVVTAQRRSENLQRVPIAVTAITATQLDQSNIRGIEDLTIAVPSLKIVNSNAFLSTSLRGLGSTAVGPGFENPVALYIDGVYIASQQASYLNLSNISQVDVLKGPQGTLFGRNATAGLIQVTTRTPMQGLSGDARVSFDNYETLEGTAYLSGGLAPGIAADIAAYGRTQGEGFGRNLTTGADTYKTDHEIVVRSKVQVDAGPDTTITLVGDYSDFRGDPMISAALPGQINAYDRATGPQPDRGYDSILDSPRYKDGWQAGGSLRLEHSFGSVEFMSLTAYRESSYYISADYDYSQRPLANYNYVQDERQFTQEFQLRSAGSGPFTWVAGAYFFDGRAGYQPFNLNLELAGIRLNISNSQLTSSLAGFAQGTYALTDTTKLSLGVRYTDETREAVGGVTNQTIIATGVVRSTPAPDKKVSFDKVTFRAAIDQQFSDAVLGYVSFNRGFKAGGFNTGSPGTEAYRPEVVDAYEAGIKSKFLGNRVRLNVAGFYYDYQDIQSTRLAAGVIQVVNAATARVYGADVDFEVVATDALRFTGGLGWTDAKFTSYPGAFFRVPTGGAPSVPRDAKGNTLPLASEFTANISGNYEIDLESSRLNLNANAYYNSGYFLEVDNVTEQGEHVIIGANVTWTDDVSGISVGVFGRNLTNQRLLSYSSTQAGNGSSSAVYAAPRTYGVSVGVEF